MGDIISEILYNSDTLKVDTERMCDKICAYKWDILDRLDSILTNPHYDSRYYKNPCIVINPCEKDMRDSCVFQFINDISI